MKVVSPATTPARIGAITAGISTLDVSSLNSTADVPTAAIVEPTIPPMRACDDEDGTPNHQVTRFQVLPPTSPAKITVVVMAPASTIPFATVAATLIEMNAPTKFRAPAMPTAILGFSAPVAIVVAIAFAVS